jgi:hypothetical protein
MNVNVVVKPEVGGIAWCYGNLIMRNDMPMIETIIGIISEVGEDYIKIDKLDYKIPIYAVVYFTFGGIRTVNKNFDKSRMDKHVENELKKMRRKK